MNRRCFLSGMILPLIPSQIGKVKATSIESSMEREDELRQILFNSPHLFRFRAEDGHQSYVWLDGEECSGEVTEMMASPLARKSVRGAVCRLVRDEAGQPTSRAGSIVTKWTVGLVRWKLR